ncbi:hypothetical protein HYPSUDRAFT_448730 [Hypholoma sublateritium FD-334 SS-4]|uniref:Uncharacterized protein n=1 Tax=Hypholoma sublateritium (strain FD-334 SS-4) TaxID=945553 RepID=A0A0D2N555_HYPSF|nr:hypothetical protein HYPSUDRAFT_448730 [Hypholoma sublateritium FD-334 SS-4]
MFVLRCALHLLGSSPSSISAPSHLPSRTNLTSVRAYARVLSLASCMLLPARLRFSSCAGACLPWDSPRRSCIFISFRFLASFSVLIPDHHSLFLRFIFFCSTPQCSSLSSHLGPFATK